MSAEVLRLVPRQIPPLANSTVVDTFRTIQRAAAEGLVLGSAHVLILAGRHRYITSWCGIAEENPTLTLGAVNVLRAELEDLVLQLDANGQR